ncbi:alginate export family protein [Lentisphaera marina]|uniref:alginate export family protein n=1 Tax=Lentisphaera marina TaxID=1111041 RepID=UPI0023665AA8|nr:alginate export family protein [Lentisphaera marina]MDD7984483.1 alginate export family protein [Lentisphaera marina]
MKKFATCFLMSALAATAAEKANDFGEIFTKGELDLKARLGYEHASVQGSANDDANALTLSNYVGFRTAEIGGLSFYAQYHSNQRVVSDYNDTEGHGAGEYEVVADPDVTRWQQVYADFTLIPDTKVRVGRQVILQNDVRFIGNIGWRQTEQTFDAVSITNKSIDKLELFAAYADKVNTIFGNSVEYDHILMFNAKYKLAETHTLTGFSYFVDGDEDLKAKGGTAHKGATTNDSATYGVRVDGKFDDFIYDATFAYQTDYADSDDNETMFTHLYGGYKMGDWTPGLGYMFIDERDENFAFDTLFSTAHKFNGWSDRFLGTNGGNLADGLQDYYIDLKGSFMGNKVVLAYHYFDDVAGNDDYGMEYNALVARKLTDNLTASVKAAYFVGNDDRGDGYANDDMNVWLRLDYAIGSKIGDLFK